MAKLPNASIQFARPDISDAEIASVVAAMESGWIVGGPRMRDFEQRCAELSGARYGVATASWTGGAFLVLKALGIGPGDEVIVPSLTFIASVNVISHVGATPVFADIDPDTWNIDPDDVAAKISSRTRAIMPVDQLGLPCDIDAITDIARRHGLHVLDDAACAFGSQNRGRPVGSLADVTVFSLHARKVVTTGEGGMIVSDNEELMVRLAMLRHQGMSLTDHQRHDLPPTTFETYPEIGYNFRMTDIQAAIGLAQLDRLPEMLAHRSAVARRYQQAFADHPAIIAPGVPDGLEPNWQSYMLGIRPEASVTRNEVMEALFHRAVPTRRGVMASHLEPPYRGLACELPVTEAVAAQNLLLPMHSALTSDEVDYIIASVHEVTGV